MLSRKKRCMYRYYLVWICFRRT